METETNQVRETLSGIEAAVRRIGGRRELAEALGITPQYVSVWMLQGYVPDKYIQHINRLTDVPTAALLNPAIVAMARNEDPTPEAK